MLRGENKRERLRVMRLNRCEDEPKEISEQIEQLKNRIKAIHEVISNTLLHSSIEYHQHWLLRLDK